MLKVDFIDIGCRLASGRLDQHDVLFCLVRGGVWCGVIRGVQWQGRIAREDTGASHQHLTALQRHSCIVKLR